MAEFRPITIVSGFRPIAFGANLGVVRLESDASQDWLARQMRRRGFRWQQSTVSKVEAGTRNVSFAEVDALVSLFGPCPLLNGTHIAAAFDAVATHPANGGTDARA